MKVLLVNKSDTIGGAAIVTRRLLHALRNEGIDAKMLVAEKLSDDPFIDTIAPNWLYKISFINERLKIYRNNGRSKENLFKIDIASDGSPILRHKWLKDADIVCLNWINQATLSLSQIQKIANYGKKIVWTMHDMWNATAICHHTGNCDNFTSTCCNCPLLGTDAGNRDLAYKTMQIKHQLYSNAKIHFVAVSNWLANRCKNSSLLKNANISVIPNPFPIQNFFPNREIPEPGSDINIIMGAARLDDPIKGFEIAIAALNKIAETDLQLAEQLHFTTFGNIRNPQLFNKINIKHTHLGNISDFKILQNAYLSASIVLSTSHYETLPGTLIEGQAFGCLPIAFDHGGQADIINHKINGFLAKYSDDFDENVLNIFKGILWAVKYIYGQKYGRIDHPSLPSHTPPYNIANITYKNVLEKFSEKKVAQSYISLFKNLLSK